MGISFSFIWRHATRTGILPADARATRQLIVRDGLGNLAYLVAIGLAWVSAPASLILCGLVAVYYIHPGPMRL